MVWVADGKDSWEWDGLIEFRCGVVDRMEEKGVSILTSSLIPEELSLGTIGGGGVCIRSSRVFQNDGPPAFLMAWCVKVLEDRLLLIEASDIDSRLSRGPAVAGAMFGEDAVVVG